jgi:hypothetical protein
MLMWAMVMLLMIYFMFGVAFTNACYSMCFLQQDLSEEQCVDLNDRFGTFRTSVLSLYMSMMGGVDWGDIYVVIEPMGVFYSYLYLFYLFFTLFGIVNVITGIFVESAMQASQGDREILVKSQLATQDKYMKDMLRFFQEIDVDGSGTIGLEEFESNLEDERALAYFEAMKLDISEVKTLFQLMDVDGSGDINVEEFISGCQRLKGETRALDFCMLHYELEAWFNNLLSAHESTERQINELHMLVDKQHDAASTPVTANQRNGIVRPSTTPSPFGEPKAGSSPWRKVEALT